MCIFSQIKNRKMIQMKLIKRIAFLTLFALTLNVSAQSVQLQYNFKKGDTYLIEMSMKQNMAPIMSMDLGITMRTETINVEQGKFESKSNIKRLAMDLAAQGEKMSFDSDAKVENLSEEDKKLRSEIEPAMKVLIYQTLDKTGKVVSQKTVPQMKDAERFLQQNELTNIEYPTKSLSVGSSWETSQTVSGMKMNTKFTVKQITSAKVFADISGNVEGVEGANIDGTLEVDRKTGMPLNVKIDLNMGAAAMGMSMTVEMKAKKI